MGVPSTFVFVGGLVVVEKEILISVEVGDPTMIYSVYFRG